MTEQLRLLLVDDDEVDRMAICRALRQSALAVAVTEVTHAEQALERLRQEPYDCVFLDYQLPDRDGLTLIQHLRREGVTLPLSC